MYILKLDTYLDLNLKTHLQAHRRKKNLILCSFRVCLPVWMVFGTIPERNRSGTCIPLLQCHSDNPLDISYGDISQWQWMSGWQGGLEEKENYIPVPDAPLCAVPAMAGELGAFTFAKVLGRKSTVVIGRVQVFWGWDAASSRIFLNRYFCSILFVQKLGKKSGVFFFISRLTLSVGFLLIQVLFLSDLHLLCLWDVKDAVDTSKDSSSLSSYPRHHFNMACLMLHISVSVTKWQWKLLHSSENGAEWKPQHTALCSLSSVSSVSTLPPLNAEDRKEVWALKTRFKSALTESKA